MEAGGRFTTGGRIPAEEERRGSPSVHAPIRLGPGDADRYARLRIRMLSDSPWAFEASPEEDPVLDPIRLAALLNDRESAIFAVEAGPAERGRGPGDALEEPAGRLPVLLGAMGITRMTHPRFAHRARVWGVFVEPTHRGLGLGRALLGASLEEARRWPGMAYVDLSVSEYSPEALGLYEAFGFRVWGREPEATDVQGRRYDELHMSLRI
jgi:ribosomal protein S18 acetylase RimI-like enzyme